MKIIVRKSDDVAVYAVNSVLKAVDGAIVCDNVIIGDLNLSDVEILDGDPPDDFRGGAFVYKSGVWSLNPKYVDQPAPNNTGADLMIEIVQATQQRLDSFARTRNYDSILSLCTYATSTNPKFKVEGQYGVEVRDATWAKLYSILTQVEASSRPVPAGYAEIEPELPVLAWPN